MNKIIHQFQFKIIPGIVFLSTTLNSFAWQDTTVNRYGLQLITTPQQLQKTISLDPAREMIDIKKKIPGIVLDLRYAGSNNFMHQQLYPTVSTTFLRKPVAYALAEVQSELNKKGLGLKIFDAYRPYHISQKMWDMIHDERYVAEPKKGSRHNRGIAVDLTIINLATQVELDMGTGFDNFSDTAHHDFINLPKQVLHNRKLLKKIMAKHGFEEQSTEWWHYSIAGFKYFEVMDIPIEDL
jgi:D-alanyl-D-alanine dipeptidase